MGSRISRPTDTEKIRHKLNQYLVGQARKLCMVSDEECVELCKAGGLFSDPHEMSAEMYQTVSRVVLMQYYAEWWGARQYECAFRLAPNERARKAFQKIVAEEYGHANMVWHGNGVGTGPLDILQVDPSLFLAETADAQICLLRIFQHPGFENWTEVIMYGHLQDRSAAIQLRDFAEGSFTPWGDVLTVIDREEQFHIRHGERWIEKIAESPEGKHALQGAVNKWFPHAMDVFGRAGGQSKTEKLLLQYHLKHKTNDEARVEFVGQVEPLIIACGLELPHWVFKPNRPF